MNTNTAPAAHTATDDSEIIAAILASPDFAIFEPMDWELECEHTGETSTDSDGWIRCLTCGLLALGW